MVGQIRGFSESRNGSKIYKALPITVAAGYIHTKMTEDSNPPSTNWTHRHILNIL